MTVQCPHCQTQYRVPASRLSGSRPVFKCTKCKHVFETEPERAPRRRRRDPDDENLALPFDAGSDVDEASREDEDPPSVDEGDVGEDDDHIDDGEGEELVEEPAWVRSETDRKPRKATTRAGRTPRLAAPPPEPEVDDELDDLSEEEDEEPPVVVAPPKKKAAKIRPRAPKKPPRRSPLKPISICVGLILGFYSLVAFTLTRDPADTLAWLSEVPILGGLLGKDHLLVWRLEVTELKGGLDYIRDHKLAYVVSGRAVNTTREDLRIIEVEGNLIVDGKPARRQRVYAANQARSTIRDLSASEVEMLLRLEPNRRFRIRPGESASFLLVFPSPPAALDEVVVRVVDARVT